MRLQLTVTHRASSTVATEGLSSVDVEVDAPRGSTAGELVAELADHLALVHRSAAHQSAAHQFSAHQCGAHQQLALVVDGRIVEPHTLIGSPPLLDGAAVSLQQDNPLQASRTPKPRLRRATVVLAVTHGPDCGRTLDLHRGRLTLGRSDEADVRIDDPRLSRLHAEIVVGADGVTLGDLGSTNGTHVDGESITGAPVTLTTSSAIRLGDSVVALRHPGAVPAATTATGEGTLAVNRRPRVPEAHPPVEIPVPTPPAPPRRTRVPWMAVLLPLPVAAVLAVVVGPAMLAFALMGPVLMVGSALSDRWGSRRTYAAERVRHDAQLREAKDRIAAACRDEARVLARSSPDPATILQIATGPTERLWERRRHDDDAFTVTIGRCRRDASLRLVRPGSGDLIRQPQVQDAPCTVSLTQVGVLGLCGDGARVAASARLLVAQLVTLHSPADLQVVALLRDPGAADRWSWLRRIPHCCNVLGTERLARLAVLDHEDTAALAMVAALATTIQDRSGTHCAPRWEGPTTLVLVDGAAAFRGVPDLAKVLTDGPGVGVVCIALDTERTALPHEAGAILDLPLDRSPTLALPGHHHEDLLTDGVESAWAERLSRSLAPLRDASPSDGPSALPSSTGLLACGSPFGSWPDGTAAESDVVALLRRAWERQPHSTSVPLGVCSTGTFTIDLAADGPHVLVGGTTGSGKSELLRTLVASLALHNTPQHLSFVLVDYKGGAAFRECADLPHVAGVVTDLDDRLATRALTSLTAEVTRRERLLRAAGAIDFVSYQRCSAGVVKPLARLVVVVDEFRALVDELPAFVDGLVRLASLGRSLGIHLVLATQRPAGVVTADIKANVNLRIALRVRDGVDSEDVVDSPAAAGIDPTTPGRAQLRTGGAALVEFQAAHVGSVLPEPGPRSVGVWRSGSAGPSCRPPRPADGERTELVAIVDVVRRTTALERIKPAPAAWLPPLPQRIPHPSLEEAADPSTVHLGMVDLPEQQRQEPLAFDLRARGHWAVVGGPGSGRSTSLLTLARSVCAKRDRQQLHVHAISAGSLAALESLPHVGACIDWSDVTRVERLVTRLSAEVADRRAALALRGGTTSDPWWGRGDEDPAAPSMLLLLDDWDLASSRTDDLALASLFDRLLALLRAGEAVGLTAVLAGDRSLLLGRAGAAVSRRVVLRLSDPSDAVLLGLAPRQVAALRGPGHGLTSDGHEVQLALPPDLPSLPEHPPSPTASTGGARAGLPLRVDALPATVHEQELLRNPFERGTIALGIGGDESAVLGLDPRRDGCRWLVTGSAGSGVSTTLLLVARRLLASGRPVAVVAHRHGPLEVLRCEPGVAAWCDGPDTTALVAARRDAPALAVVVDTADELLDHPVEAVLREIAYLADRDAGLLVVGARSDALTSMYRGLAFEVARHRTGVLLGPASSADAQAFGVRVPVDRGGRPGRGHVVCRGAAVPLQVAFPTPPDPLAVRRTPG